MLIKVPEGWEIPEREATPESAWQSRRRWLRAAGVAGLQVGGWLLSGAAGGLRQAAGQAKGLYPATRNPEFVLDRPLTEEAAATGYNNFYEFGTDKAGVKHLVGEFQPRPWTVEVTGLVEKPRRFDIDELERLMPLEERLYRFRCVEAWAMAVPWTGFPLAALIKLVEPKREAKFVRFQTALRANQMPGVRSQPWYPWPYEEGLRMDEAMNPLTLLATGLYGKPLPRQNGAPLRLVTPWKYGFKSIKSIVKIEFTAKQPQTFWNKTVPEEYGFYANVNPKKPHPRWSQATERMIPHGEVRPTLLYNGYGKWVAAMYTGKEY